MALAAVAGAHGVRGEVRLKLFASGVDSLRVHRDLDADGRALTLIAVRDGANGPVARFAEITDRDAADALRGVTLTVARAALPQPAPDELYVADLIGLPALADGAPVGHVVAVENFGAGDLVEVERPGGARVLVPLARCDVGDGAIVLDPLFLD